MKRRVNRRATTVSLITDSTPACWNDNTTTASCLLVFTELAPKTNQLGTALVTRSFVSVGRSYQHRSFPGYLESQNMTLFSIPSADKELVSYLGWSIWMTPLGWGVSVATWETIASNQYIQLPMLFESWKANTIITYYFFFFFLVIPTTLFTLQ